jgi:hypothetical protein
MKCEHEPCRPSQRAASPRARGRGWPNGSKKHAAAPTKLTVCESDFRRTAGARSAVLATSALTGAVFVGIALAPTSSGVGLRATNLLPTPLAPACRARNCGIMRPLRRHTFGLPERRSAGFLVRPRGFEAYESWAPRLSKPVAWMQARGLSFFRRAVCPRLRKERADHGVEGAARISCHQSTTRTASTASEPALGAGRPQSVAATFIARRRLRPARPAHRADPSRRCSR